MDPVLYFFFLSLSPSFGISSDRKDSCQNLLRGSEEKYSQSLAHKGDVKKWGEGKKKEGWGVRNQEWFNTKVHVGTYHQKEGVFVCVHVLR